MTARVQDNPPPLVVAASLAAVEASMVVLFALGELRHLSSERLSTELATVGFFAMYGAGLLFCSWQLYRTRPWARGPVLLAQLIQLGVAWSFWGGSTTAVAIGVGLVAVVVLVGIFHPASLAALEAADEESAA